MTSGRDDRPASGRRQGGGTPEADPRSTERPDERDRYYADDYASRRWQAGERHEAARTGGAGRYAGEAEEPEGFADFPGWRGRRYGNPYGPGGRRFGFSPSEHRPAGQAPGHVSRNDRDREGALLAPQPGRAEGPHRGKGPKSYRRSDDRIREDVCDMLMDDDSLDASRIDVAVEAGEVTLAGHVDDRWSKRAAEDDADRVPGVRHVQNNLRVDPARSS